jgi:DNA-binding PucR family transcriptional regulator
MSLYPNTVLYPERPTNPSEHIYIFFDETENDWIGIPKKDISENELILLKTLYLLIESPIQPFTSVTRNWYEYLLLNGLPPECDSETHYRFIQFQTKGENIDQYEMESALKGFFSEDVIIIWETSNSGIVIEDKKQVSLSDKELISMSDTLESDLYVKISFYIGKFHPFSNQIHTYFQQEKEYYTFGKTYFGDINIYSFERIFPAYLANHLPNEIRHRVNQIVSNVFNEDPEIFLSIKVFLENNLNASVTAKKLYIHRNTLQYRIDKFVEKTGIQLKDFYGAFTVFLACSFFELYQQK